MKRLALVLTLSVILAPAALARDRNISVSTEQGPVTSCDQVSVRFDHVRAYRAEESLPVRGVRSLRVTAAENGGIYVSGGSDYAVTACKASETESTLSDIRTSVRGNEVTADGPDGNWVVYFIVTVPRGGTLDLDSNNGPISLREVSATITAHATNGPISVRDSSGTLNLTTENGPISLKGGSGTVKLNANNGPISVKLDETSWNGSLDARTENGPLSVKMPRGFVSGVLIESEGHGPLSCHADACRDMRRNLSEDEDQPRRIEFGSGPTVLHMSTVNGPLSIRED
jgi:hypothetical protein